jgi:hypothetical protein
MADDARGAEQKVQDEDPVLTLTPRGNGLRRFDAPACWTLAPNNAAGA